MWLKSLQQHFSKSKKRSQHETSTASLTAEESEELQGPGGAEAEGEEYDSRAKRRSVSIDVGHGVWPVFVDSGGGGARAADAERRPSLEQWHEARRARNSLEGQGTTTTDRLTVCKAGSTTIVNKTYITIKHLGSGTFGRVMLCFNVYDQRLYAVKICSKSQFASSSARYASSSRLRRSTQAGSFGSLHSPGSSSCLTARSGAQSSGGSFTSQPTSGFTFSPCAVNAAAAGACGGAGTTFSGVTHINATSGSASLPAAAAAAAAAAASCLLGSSSGAPGGGGMACLPGRGGAAWGPGAAGGVFGAGEQQQQVARPPSPPSPPRWSEQAQEAPGSITFSFCPPPQQQQQQELPRGAGGGAGPLFLRSCDQQQQHAQHRAPRGRRTSCCQIGMTGVPPPPPLGPGVMQSSCSAGGGWGGGGGAGVLLGTDCSTGSGLSNGGGGVGGGSVFAEALMRFQTEELVKEIAILKKLHHPNIVNLVEVIDDPGTDSLLLVMEYVEGGTLQRRQLAPGRWEPLQERQVWRCVREVLQGLEYLHHHRVVHGDLKPANLLLDGNSGRVKIADFGSSIIAGGGADRPSVLGAGRNCPGFSTPAFRSPESLTSGYQLSYEMDMWALGVCVYMWVFGCLPFTGRAPYIIYERIRGQDVSLPADPDVSPELRSFIAGLLDRNVLTRLDVAGAASHPWVTLSGSAPLPSVRQQQQQPVGAPSEGEGAAGSGGEEAGRLVASPEELEGAIQRLADGGVSELMDVVFAEKQLRPGQELVRPGDVADRIFLIAHGELEVLSAARSAGGGADLTQPFISGLDLAQLAEAADPDVWDATHVADIATARGGDTDIQLLSDVLAPLGSSSCPAPPEGVTLVALKGPGDSLGVPRLPARPRRVSSSSNGAFGDAATAAAPSPAAATAATAATAAACERRWKVLVRARGPATVFVAQVGDLDRLVEAHPEMRGAVQQIVTQQETDLMVCEAMRQLRLFGDQQQQQQQHGGGCTDMELELQAAVVGTPQLAAPTWPPPQQPLATAKQLA